MLLSISTALSSIFLTRSKEASIFFCVADPTWDNWRFFNVNSSSSLSSLSSSSSSSSSAAWVGTRFVASVEGVSLLFVSSSSSSSSSSSLLLLSFYMKYI
jgi:hypothetical protein